jgi:nicotinamidase-related amidase
LADPDETLTDNYQRAYGGKIGFGKKPALLLADFVQAYFEPGCNLFAKVDGALASALRLRDVARAAGIPVILTRVTYHATGLDGGRFSRKRSHCAISARIANGRLACRASAAPERISNIQAIPE